jgi:phage regulator Rha-like protein
MSELSLIPETLTMTSREIAELTGKDHRHVLADIRKMFEDLGETSAGFSADLPDAYGRPQPAFTLPKRETYILITGYSVMMRAKIIDRWQELEAQVKKLQAEAYEKSFEKLDRSMRAIERISTTLDYTSDRIFEVTMRELERLGHPELAESFIKTGQLNVGEEHIAWTKLETLAAKLAKELVKAQKSAKKRQTPFAELSPEEYAAITTEWRKKHLPYSLVTDPAHKGQATQHALTNNTGQRKLTH